MEISERTHRMLWAVSEAAAKFMLDPSDENAAAVLDIFFEHNVRPEVAVEMVRALFGSCAVEFADMAVRGKEARDAGKSTGIGFVPVKTETDNGNVVPFPKQPIGFGTRH